MTKAYMVLMKGTVFILKFGQVRTDLGQVLLVGGPEISPLYLTGGKVRLEHDTRVSGLTRGPKGRHGRPKDAPSS